MTRRPRSFRQAVQKALLPNFNASIATKDLPLSVTPTGVRVESGSVTVKGEATNCPSRT